ncbi:predicted protein [Arabidopsis lyrata subsp. lyrata]|uniref:Predicted protein n=1 Tax=Arabidopsis lyrata subsp. lyrata TaxID=81972 RepID=D7LES5_ARALL|nr:predicted protein [Arabidopsis lyrata subsp. lyrata]
MKGCCREKDANNLVQMADATLEKCRASISQNRTEKTAFQHPIQDYLDTPLNWPVEFMRLEVHRIFCQKLQQWTQFGLNLQDWPDSIDGNGFQIMVKSFRHSFYNNAGALVGVYRDEEAKGPLEAYIIHICLPNLCKQEEHFGAEGRRSHEREEDDKEALQALMEEKSTMSLRYFAGNFTSLIWILSISLAAVNPGDVSMYTANQFTGSIPESIGIFSFLNDIDISSNNLSGTFAPSMENLSTLTTLRVQNNQLSRNLDVLKGLM